MANTKKKTCPICIREYYRTDKSHNVCDAHQGWYVTKCDTCGKVSFSNTKKLCVSCGQVKK